MSRRVALFATVFTLVAREPRDHEVVGTIGQLLLSDDTEKAVKELLVDEFLASFASRTDQVRNTTQYSYSAAYQYADLPHGVDEPDLSQACPAPSYVVQAISDHAAAPSGKYLHKGLL